MAPFSSSMVAIRMQPTSTLKPIEVDKTMREEGSFTMEANVDEEWSVGVVPNGGYLVALMIRACSIVQRETPHDEPVYLSTQYLGSSTSGPCTITVKRVKRNNDFSNIVAVLVQKGRTNIHCQVIYGTLPLANVRGVHPAPVSLMHRQAPTRRCPLVTHPSKCTFSPFTRPFSFSKYLVQAIDPYYLELLEKRGNGYSATNPMDLGGGGSTWGGWYQQLDQRDFITLQMLSFLGDIVPELLPESVAKERDAMWFPTLAMSVDFKHRPSMPNNETPGIASRTVGIFVTMRYLIEGRYEATSEIWTAPCAIGEGMEEEGWQDKMYCLASVTQSAMTVPAMVNFNKSKRNGDRSASKL